MPEVIEVRPRTLMSLLGDIDKGLLKIPRFQRDVVWELPQCVKLIDSLYRKFPIGALVVWETWDKLTEVRAIGNLELPEVPKTTIPSYVLDGQQRLTSLYACAKEAEVQNNRRKKPMKYVAWFDFEKDEFTHIQPQSGVTLKQLIATNYDEYRDNLTPDQKKKFIHIRSTLLEEYKFATIVISEKSLEDACVIFERINNSGKKLTIFDLLVAKMYPHNGFDLRDHWKQLDKQLKVFSGLNPILPMQALSLLTVKLDEEKSMASVIKYGCHKRHLLKLDPQIILDQWDELVECFKLAIDFVRTRVGVPEYKLLPYEAPLVLIALFYLLNKHKGPDEKQARLLEQYFWRSCVSARYSSSPESTMEEDGLFIRDLIEGKGTLFKGTAQVTSDQILEARYDQRDSFVLTILCMLAAQKPLFFKSATPIPIAQEFSKYNSTELHHVFPRGWLKKNGNHEWLSNEHSLANICLSPAKEQRHDIAAKPPSEYIPMFSKKNSRIDLCLESQVLDGKLKGLLEKDDFENFLTTRARIMAERLNSLAGL